MSDQSNSKIVWFIAGLGLGTVATLLYAPKSGRDTRRALANSVDDGRQYLADLGHDAREHVTGWIDTGKKVVAGRKDQVTGAIHDAAVSVAAAIK
jgi:gas vesicle protein